MPIIIAAVDPNHARHKPLGLDHKILHTAQDIGDILNADVYAVHAFSSIPLPGGHTEAALKIHRQAFEKLMSDFEFPSEQQIFMEEAPEFALQKLEQEIKANMVVMGAISRNRIADAFIGNTTEKVVDFLASDVLIVKPDGFGAAS